MRSLLWGAAVLLLFYGLHAAEPLFVSTGILRAGTRSPDRVVTVGEEIEFEVTLVAPREQGIDFQFVGNIYSSWEVTSASATRGIPKIGKRFPLIFVRCDFTLVKKGQRKGIRYL